MNSIKICLFAFAILSTGSLANGTPCGCGGSGSSQPPFEPLAPTCFAASAPSISQSGGTELSGASLGSSSSSSWSGPSPVFSSNPSTLPVSPSLPAPSASSPPVSAPVPAPLPISSSSGSAPVQSVQPQSSSQSCSQPKVYINKQPPIHINRQAQSFVVNAGSPVIIKPAPVVIQRPGSSEYRPYVQTVTSAPIIVNKKIIKIDRPVVKKYYQEAYSQTENAGTGCDSQIIQLPSSSSSGYSSSSSLGSSSSSSSSSHPFGSGSFGSKGSSLGSGSSSFGSGSSSFGSGSNSFGSGSNSFGSGSSAFGSGSSSLGSGSSAFGSGSSSFGSGSSSFGSSSSGATYMQPSSQIPTDVSSLLNGIPPAPVSTSQSSSPCGCI